MLKRTALLALFVHALLTSSAIADVSGQCRPGSRLMARADLFFGVGASKPGDWRRFLGAVVTPRFSDGLTSLEGTGQWRGPRGLTKEATHVLVILHEPDAKNDVRLEEIRTLYKRRFRQQSVLRVDSTACVGF